MTSTTRIKVQRKTNFSFYKTIFLELFSLFSLIILVAYCLFGAPFMKEHIIEGAKLSFYSVIPSAFPFMILSDFLMSNHCFENLKLTNFILRKLFNINDSMASCVLIGNLGGFPQGAKCLQVLLDNGTIDKKSAEYLLPLCTNPSLPFVINCVGLSFFNNIKIGFIFTISIFISTVITGILFRSKIKNSSNTVFINRQTFDIVQSISSSGQICLNITSFIIFFFTFNKLLNLLKISPLIKDILICFSEITCSLFRYSELFKSNQYLAIFLGGMTLGFCGLSALLQSFSLVEKHKLSIFPYLKFKLIQMFFCGIFSVLLFNCFFK